MELTPDPRDVMGIDGCRGGWIVATGSASDVRLHWIPTIEEAWTRFPHVHIRVIDMIMGLPTRPGERTLEQQLMPLLGSRRSSIFRVPCRSSVEAPTKALQYAIHEREMQEKLTPFGVLLISKIRELDGVIRAHLSWQEHTYESHPETCFRLLKGSPLRYSKKTNEGIEERVTLLLPWVPQFTHRDVQQQAHRLGCAPDDVVDALVMYVTALLHRRHHTHLLLNEPLTESRGVMMRVVLPHQHQTDLG